MNKYFELNSVFNILIFMAMLASMSLLHNLEKSLQVGGYLIIFSISVFMIFRHLTKGIFYQSFFYIIVSLFTAIFAGNVYFGGF
jgi:hypothetical protein